MKIVWVCDVKGWAFDNESRCVALGFPGHTHVYTYAADDYKWRRQQIREADVVVLNSPNGIKYVARELWSKVILRITGIRSLSNWRR